MLDVLYDPKLNIRPWDKTLLIRVVRGFLREGAPADIVVYNLEQLKVLPVEIAHDLPGDEWRRVQRAEGYSHIIVNGQITWEGDHFTGATPGKVLRHGVSA